ncbi:MAG: DUF4760 domain-containing protein [Rhizobacter sp.]|nr:DUF4760 domain-containing protein [Ferruginibacter sp.]
MLNYFESLALLLDDKIIDEAILEKGFRTAILSYYETFREYIEDEQREPGNARVFVNFVSLAKRWQQS